MSATPDVRRQKARINGSCHVDAILIALIAASGCSRPDPYDVPTLTKSLKDPDASTRYTSAEVLGQYGGAAKPAIPALIEALKDSDTNVRMRAAYSIASIGADESAVPVLIECLKDEHREVRIAAAYALGALGPTARAALPVLRRLQTHRDQGLRSEVAKSIRRIELAVQYGSEGHKS